MAAYTRAHRGRGDRPRYTRAIGLACRAWPFAEVCCGMACFLARSAAPFCPRWAATSNGGTRPPAPVGPGSTKPEVYPSRSRVYPPPCARAWPRPRMVRGAAGAGPCPTAARGVATRSHARGRWGAGRGPTQWPWAARTTVAGRPRTTVAGHSDWHLKRIFNVRTSRKHQNRAVRASCPRALPLPTVGRDF